MDIFFPIQQFANWLTYDLLTLQTDNHLATSLNFFIYDTIKIITLLLVINYIMAIFRHYLPTAKIKNILTSRNWYGFDYLLASFFGVITPFCSCSSIPLFIGFVGSGIPLGVTFAFLITSPLVNETSLALFPALFGWKTTIIYNIMGILVGITGGFVIQKLNMEKFIEPSLLKFKSSASKENKIKKIEFLTLLRNWLSEDWQITKSLIPYVILGIGVGAFIHGFIPANFFEHYLTSKQWWTVPLATMIGVPLYANSVSVLPIMEALLNKGIPLGTALSFMTAVVTLSIPEALILKKVIKLPLLVTFYTITILGIIVMGYFFNSVYG